MRQDFLEFLNKIQTDVVHDRQEKWDRDFLHLAGWYALMKSKDPSTKCGAVIVAPDRSIVSLGYNGFPRGVNDDPVRYADRELKYKLVVHAEANAMLFARRDLVGCTLYTWPLPSCARCAGMAIQCGISRCVAPVLPEHLVERWGKDIELSTLMFLESGVELVLIPGTV